MKVSESLRVRGLEVEKIFYVTQEPTITHGAFELENMGEVMLVFSISQVRCLGGADAIPIDEFFLYLMPEYEEQDPSRVELPPASKCQYEVSFRPLPAVAYLSEDIRIEVTLDLDGESVQVLSAYKIVRRTPKAH